MECSLSGASKKQVIRTFKERYELNDEKKELFKRVGRYTFEEYGFPTWYIDSLVYLSR